jgi:hypothetical protein
MAFKHMIARGLIGRRLRLTKRGIRYIAQGGGIARKKLTSEEFNKLTLGGGSGGHSRSIKPLRFKFKKKYIDYI